MRFRFILTSGFILTILSVFFCILHPTTVFAATIFEDDFNSLDTTKWQVDYNDGEVSVISGILSLTAPTSQKYPYLYPKNFSTFGDNFSIESRFKIGGFYNYGFGISLTDYLLTNQNSNDLQWEDSIVFAWPNGYSSGTFSIYSMPCPENDSSCPDDDYRTAIFTGSLNTWHTLMVSYDSGVYKIYVNGELKLTSKPSVRKISTLWLGNPQKTNSSVTRGNLQVDYIRIESLEAEPEENIPIVVVPGMGASWDYDAMLAGTPGSNWHIPSFIPVYNNLIDSLINAGYTENTDLFIFPYDWRKNLTDLGNDLDVFINSKIGADKKINFVSHSMGGLVVRSWANSQTDRVNKIVTAGTPHKGATDAYSAWEGATLFERPWWLRAPFELMVELNRQPAETHVAAVRRLMPAFSNLLPIYDYLNDGSLLAWNSLNQANPVLDSWNTASLDSLLWTLAGKDQDTKGQLLVTERGWLDRVMGRWEDGKPTGVTPVDGDGTVILSSSLGGFSSTQELNSTNHEQVIDSQVALEAIFDQLGLDKSKIVTNSGFDLIKKVFIASLRSPGNLQVCNSSNVCDDDLGILIEDEDLFFLPDYNGEDLQVKVIGDAEGSYHLYLGRLEEEESKWQKFLGDITVGEEDIFGVSSAGGEMTVEDEQVVILTGRQLTNAYSSLIRKIRQDYKAMNWQAMEANIDKWQELDRMAAMGKPQASYVNRTRRLVEIYGQKTSAKLANSQSYYAGVLFEMGQNNTQTAKTKETLTSAENLFKLAELLKK